MGPADAPQGAFVLLISINAPGVRLNGSSIVVVESSHPNVNEKWGSSSPKFRGEGSSEIFESSQFRINDSSNLHFPEILPERFPTLLQEKMSLLSLRTAMKFQEQWALSQQNKARDTSETFKALMTFHYIDWFIGILIMAYHNTYVYITG